MKTKYIVEYEGKEYSINTERIINYVVLSGPRSLYDRKTHGSYIGMQANWYDCIEKANKTASVELKRGWKKAIVLKV
jgi:hypothetical protein